MMQEIESRYDAVFYGFVNGDILFHPSLLSVLREVEQQIRNHSLYNEVFLVGRRINYPLDYDALLPFAASDQVPFILERARRGEMFQADAEVEFGTAVKT